MNIKNILGFLFHFKLIFQIGFNARFLLRQKKINHSIGSCILCEFVANEQHIDKNHSDFVNEKRIREQKLMFLSMSSIMQIIHFLVSECPWKTISLLEMPNVYFIDYLLFSIRFSIFSSNSSESLWRWILVLLLSLRFEVQILNKILYFHIHSK